MSASRRGATPVRRVSRLRALTAVVGVAPAAEDVAIPLAPWIVPSRRAVAKDGRVALTTVVAVEGDRPARATAAGMPVPGPAPNRAGTQRPAPTQADPGWRLPRRRRRST